MLILVLWLAGADSVRIRPLSQAPVVRNSADLASLGAPSLTLAGGASVWLLKDSTAVVLIASLSDSTPAWNDRVVLTLDTNGDRAASPQHDDFQWDFHRVADSSVIYRGRDGRWQPPHDDPDWRLGHDRDGGGWSVREKEVAGGWVLIVRFDPEYFSQAGRIAPGLGIASFDEGLRRWDSWPAVSPGRQPGSLPDHPSMWGIVLR